MCPVLSVALLGLGGMVPSVAVVQAQPSTQSNTQDVQHAAPAPTGPTSVPVVVPVVVSDLTDREVRILKAFSTRTPPVPTPTNRFGDSETAAALGARLFFEKGLSGNGTVSCATCHRPDAGWADGLRVAEGVGVGSRNTPSVLNAAHGLWQFWDGRADSLWSQALSPIENATEMAGSRVGAVRLIARTPELLKAYQAAFGPMSARLLRSDFPERGRPAPIDPHNPFGGPTESDLQLPDVRAWERLSEEDRAAVNQAFASIGKAIGAYERTLLSGPALFDLLGAALRGGQEEDLTVLDSKALHGWRLFVGKANCIACHFGPQFTDGRFHNLGLPLPEGLEPEEGRPDGIRRMRVDPMNGRGAFSDDATWDANQKLLYVASSEHVIGAFKTPSLRDVARTAPYSHDGRFATLGDVLDFYSELPGEQATGHREETLVALKLTEAEKGALLAFLHSLTGPPVSAPPHVVR